MNGTSSVLRDRAGCYAAIMNSPPRPKLPIGLRLIIIAAVIGIVWAARPKPPPAATPENAATQPAKPVTVEVIGADDASPSAQLPEAEGPRPLGSAAHDDKFVIKSVTLKNQSGRVIYKGDIELAPTLDRIAAGQKLRFANDGSIFQNREKRLPKKPSGHYREYVVPTPGEDGPGPQRLVVGDDGETFYTHDHYRTFRRIK